jgi:hypothetical protein
MPDPFETYLGKAREFVEIAFEVATIGGGYSFRRPELR